MRRASAILAVTAILASGAVGVSACGDDASSGAETGGPSTVVPADALVYAEATVRPEGGASDDAEAAVERLLGVADAGAEIRALLDRSFADDDQDLTYAEDIEPWLGERAAIYFLDFSEDANGAFIVETTDEAAASRALDEIASSEGVREERTVEGVDYKLTKEDSAVGVVDGYAVVGSVTGFEAVVEARAAESLAEAEGFAPAVAEPPDGALVTAYVSPDAAAAAADASELQGDDPEAVAALVDEPVVAYAGGEENGFFLELRGISGGGEGDLLERAPSDAWFAIGAADLGPRLRPILELGAVTNSASLRTLAGLQLDALAGALGDGLGYVSGESVLGIGAALAFEVTDDEIAETALASLRDGFANDRALTVEEGDSEGEAFSVGLVDAPVAFPFVHRDGLLVIGLGDAAIEQIFEPQSRLGDSPAYEAAASALGEDFVPIALLDFGSLATLLAGIPDALSDPDLAAAMPYIERLDQFAMGTSDDGLRIALQIDRSE